MTSKAYAGRIRTLALEQDPANLPDFYEDLERDGFGHSLLGHRRLLQPAGNDVALDMDIIRKSLDDESHHVRIMAAWILYRGGDKAAAQACWNELLKESSYASLKIFNIIDWIGDGVEPYADAMKACEFSHGGYVGRMQQYLGVKTQPQRKQRRSKKTGK